MPKSRGLGKAERHRAFSDPIAPRQPSFMGRHNESKPRSERADPGESVGDFVGLPCVVVPVELGDVLASGELVRAVAERLGLPQGAAPEKLLLSTDRQLVRPWVSAFYDARHGGLLFRTDLLLRLFCSNGAGTAMRPPALHQLIGRA